MQKAGQKTIFILAVLLCALGMRATAQDGPGYYREAYGRQYPLLVNEEVTTVLIFPEAITENGIDRGSPNIIAKQVDGVPNVLKVKADAKDFAATNLTVITKDGKVYSFRVGYSRDADDRPIDLGKERQKEGAVAFFQNRALNDVQVRQLAGHIATRKPFMRRPRQKSFGIRARLKGIYISRDVIFYRLEVGNRTNIDYGLDFMRFYIRDKKRIKRTAQQEEELTPLYVFKEHGSITAGRTRQALVIAFPKFTVADHKNFEVQLFEKNGDRNLTLKIDGNDISHAEEVPFSPEL